MVSGIVQEVLLIIMDLVDIFRVKHPDVKSGIVLSAYSDDITVFVNNAQGLRLCLMHFVRRLHQPKSFRTKVKLCG